MLTNDPNAIDGIADDAASRYVRGGKGAIAIVGYAGEEVNVCNLAGQTVSNGNAAEGVHYVIVEPGVYVVKAGRVPRDRGATEGSAQDRLGGPCRKGTAPFFRFYVL